MASKRQKKCKEAKISRMTHRSNTDNNTIYLTLGRQTKTSRYTQAAHGDYTFIYKRTFDSKHNEYLFDCFKKLSEINTGVFVKGRACYHTIFWYACYQIKHEYNSNMHTVLTTSKQVNLVFEYLNIHFVICILLMFLYTFVQRKYWEIFCSE